MCLPLTPACQDVNAVWDKLSPISEKFTIAAAFGNARPSGARVSQFLSSRAGEWQSPLQVHGVYKPGNARAPVHGKVCVYR